jgi:hypothetical protein
MRTFCLATNIISPHQLPLARRLTDALQPGSFRYVAAAPADAARRHLGWTNADAPWLLRPCECPEDATSAQAWLRTSDVLLCGLRDPHLFQERAAQGLITLYMAERWFKPPLGRGRLLHPRFLALALRMRRAAASPYLHHLAIGAQAARDLHAVVPFPGRTWLWGYFVEPTVELMPATGRRGRALRVLWAGRMLPWKRVDLLLHALAACRILGHNVILRLVGYGPAEQALRQLAKALRVADAVTFEPPVPIERIRLIMREADVYVLSSDGNEGWGAVINESMSEGCCTVASDAGGAAQTMIQDGINGLLFPSGDSRALALCLARLAQDESFRARLATAGRCSLLDSWTPAAAAERLLRFCDALRMGRPPPAFSAGPLQRLV